MRNFWLWVFLMTALLVVTVLCTNEARGDSFEDLAFSGEARGDPRANPETISRAREYFSKNRVSRFGGELVVASERNMVAVPIDRRYRSEWPGYQFRRVTENGVNSHFEVLEPANRFVILYTKRVRGVQVSYVPWSPYLDTLALRGAGLMYLRDLLERSERRLAKVRSRIDPRTTVSEVVPEDLIIALVLIEHIDAIAINEGEPLIPHAHKVLVTLGANGGDAYRFSRSPAGARGIAQFMPATYEATRVAYPRARLTMSFLRAMIDHENSVTAMYCVVDSIIANLPLWQRRRLLQDRSGLSLGLYIAGAYNAGDGAAWRMYNRYQFARRYAPRRAAKMYLGKFEALWNLRN